MTPSLVSALKRNDRKDILVNILMVTGADSEKVSEVKEASRITPALIDRVCVIENVEVNEDGLLEEGPGIDDPVSLTFADDLTPARQVELSIAEDDFKGAKKLLKNLDKEHPNYKGFKKAIKKGLK